jgi:integration host factor subunit beta
VNKADIIKEVCEKNNVEPKVAKAVIESFFDSMAQSLKSGERIEIRGFGSFSVRHYGAYKGRNPKTGEIVDIPPKRLPFFKAGKEIKEIINKALDSPEKPVVQ